MVKSGPMISLPDGNIFFSPHARNYN